MEGVTLKERKNASYAEQSDFIYQYIVSHNPMNSWLEFEKRFREVAAKLSHIRIDHQWGTAGEYWRIAGSTTTPTVQEFELLATLAGKSLIKAVKKPTSDAEFVFSEPDHKIRWYRALNTWSGEVKNDLYAYQTDENGKFSGNIFSSTMYDPALLSANLCLRLQTDFPLSKKSFWRTLWDEYGSKIVVGAVVTGITTLVGLILKFLIG